MGVKCDLCNGTFHSKSSMYRHRRTLHPDVIIKTERPRKQDTRKRSGNAVERRIMECPICNISGTKANLRDHYYVDHSIEYIEESLTFPSVDMFEEWKTEMEKKSTAQFIKRCAGGAERRDGCRSLTYICSRSGYSSSAAIHKKPPLRGTSKIQGYCPARLAVVIRGDGPVFVKYFKTHVGHSLELRFIRLTADERLEIGKQIKQDIPFDTIMDSIRTDVVENNLERLHLINRQDLYNIERTFNALNPHRKHANDHVNVASWVEEMRPSGLIKYYKGLHQDSDDEVLSKEDFFLVIFNDRQQKMLETFGPKCVCVDGPHGLNAYGFELHAILVLDDLDEGFPACFLISNRADTAAMKLFFEVVASAVRTPFKTGVFMSDVAEAYYSAWCTIFPEPDKRAYCSWHVDKAWRKNLNKIKSVARQKEAYHHLRMLLDEKDPSTFTLLLSQTVRKWMNDPIYRAFGEYFGNEFVVKSEYWAYCHRLFVGINAYMHLERMHKTLNYVYLHGKNVKRLDKALHALIKLCRDKIFDKEILPVSGGELTSRIEALRKSHKAAMESTFVLKGSFETGVWTCSSSSSNEVYHIMKNDREEGKCKCPLFCDDCNECIHAYSCSCQDSCIEWNMCKHIHFLCRVVSSIPPPPNIEPKERLACSEDVKLDLTEAVIAKDVSAISDDVGSHVDAERKNLFDEFEKIKERISRTTNVEEIIAARNILKSIIPTLDAVKKEAEAVAVNIKPSVPSNRVHCRKRNREPQRNVNVDEKRKPLPNSITKPLSCDFPDTQI